MVAPDRANSVSNVVAWRSAEREGPEGGRSAEVPTSVSSRNAALDDGPSTVSPDEDPAAILSTAWSESAHVVAVSDEDPETILSTAWSESAHVAAVPDEDPAAIRSTVCPESAHVAGPSEEPVRVCATVAPLPACPEPPAEVAQVSSCAIPPTPPCTSRTIECVRQFRNRRSRWFASTIRLTSCSRLGQPVMAIPRIFDCLTASEQNFACYCLCYHALNFKIHLSYEFELLSLDTRYPEYRTKREIVAELRFIKAMRYPANALISRERCLSFLSVNPNDFFRYFVSKSIAFDYSNPLSGILADTP